MTVAQTFLSVRFFIRVHPCESVANNLKTSQINTNKQITDLLK